MPGVPVDVILFALTLAGVAVFHHRTLEVAVSGLAAIALYKVLLSPFPSGPGVTGLAVHLSHGIRGGWHVAVAYIVGFFVMLALLGWQPHERQKTERQKAPGSVAWWAAMRVAPRR